MESGENTLVKITGSEDYDFSEVIEADRLEQEKEANRKQKIIVRKNKVFFMMFSSFFLIFESEE